MLKKYPCTMQHDQSDCAAAVVSTVLLSYKKELSIMKIREIIGTDMYGTTVSGIVSGLNKLNFTVKAVRVALEDLTPKLTFPAILQVKNDLGQNHFVVLHSIKRNSKFYVADPASGIRKMSSDELGEIYQGITLFMVPNSDFERGKLKGKGLLDLFGTLIFNQKGLISTVILASFVLSIIGILSSLFSKVIMDEVIPYALKNSLYMFLIVFGIVSFLQTLLSAFRQHVLLFLSRKIDIPVLMGYYDHIIHLPYSFFGSRRVGDVLTRFQDAMTIKNVFTSVSISLVMDITLSVISAVVLWTINQSLFLILVFLLFGEFITVAEVAGVAETGHDVGVLVEALVDPGGHHRDVRALADRILQRLDPLGRGDEAQRGDVARPALQQVVDGGHEGVTGGEHGVDDEALAGPGRWLPPRGGSV